VPRPAKQARSRQSHADEASQAPSGPRPTWSGSLSFGLVTIPVELYPASRAPALRAHSVTEDGVRVTRKYYCERDDRDLEPEDLARGVELPNGKFALVEDEELEALAPKKSREIELRLFTDREEVHPALFERAYVLAPARDNTGGKAYRLLAEVMHERRCAGIATFVLREREYIIAIFSDGQLLHGETLRFADELRDPSAAALPTPKPAQKTSVSKFTRALEETGKGRFDPTSLVDPAHEQLAKLLEAKRRKGEIVQPPEAAPTPPDEGAEVVDLMRLLKQSLQGQAPADESDASPKKAGAKARPRRKSARRAS